MVPSLLGTVENLFAGCRKERPVCPSRARLTHSIRLVVSASHARGRRHIQHSCPRLTTLGRVLTHRSTPPLQTQPESRSHPTREPSVAECQPDIASQVRSVCTLDGRNGRSLSRTEVRPSHAHRVGGSSDLPGPRNPFRRSHRDDTLR